MIAQTMVTRLKATAGVTALVSTRVYPVIRPQASVLPAIVYVVLSDIPSNHATGTSTTKNARIEVQCLASTYAGAGALAAAVETALSGWADSAGNVWHLDAAHDDPGEVQPGTDILEFHGVTQEYTVWYSSA